MRDGSGDGSENSRFKEKARLQTELAGVTGTKAQDSHKALQLCSTPTALGGLLGPPVYPLPVPLPTCQYFTQNHWFPLTLPMPGTEQAGALPESPFPYTKLAVFYCLCPKHLVPYKLRAFPAVFFFRLSYRQEKDF